MPRSTACAPLTKVQQREEEPMPSRSSKQLAIVLCAATLVALAEGIVTAEKPPHAPWQPSCGTHVRFELGRRPAELCECAQRAGHRRRDPAGVLGFCEGSPGLRTAGWSISNVDTSALAVNDHGEIAGQGNVTGSGLGARVWTRDGMMDVAVGVAYSLNNRTEVVGFHLPPVGDPPSSSTASAGRPPVAWRMWRASPVSRRRGRTSRRCR